MASRYEVLAVRFGERPLMRSDCFFRYHAYGEPDADLLLDFFFWVVRDGSSTVLVDTGFDPVAAPKRPGLRYVASPTEALAAVGIRPDDVDAVVVTHCHFDHIGNISAFPRARILVQRAEMEFWTAHGAKPPQAFSAEAAELEYLWAAAAAGRVDVLDGDAEVLPGVTAHFVGGHCPGQQVVVVDGDRPVVLASDAVHLYEELERDMPFPLFSDLPAMYRTYADLRRQVQFGAVVVPGHDHLVMERFPVVPGVPGTLAVRLDTPR